MAETAPQDIAPTVPPVPPELAQLIQAIVRDLANVEQEIEQLKTGQAELARDNAKVAEQLKANQEQMATVVAKASEQHLRLNTPARRSRSVAAPTGRPVPPLPSLQARGSSGRSQHSCSYAEQ